MGLRREPTKGTEIAALEAQRNEQQVRAEGALLGEKRAAIARLVMIAMFGLVSRLRGGPFNAVQFIAGTGYALYSAAFLIAVFRIKKARPGKARWAPIAITLFDFAVTGTLGGLDIWWTGNFSTGQHAVANAIVITFSLARMSMWHVVLSVVCAEASFTTLAIYSGTFSAHATLFVMAGYLVLGFLLALTNRAIGQMFQDLRQRDNLTRFLPRQVADRVIAQGPGALAPVEREVTVLFSDIRGFTGMSEGKTPRDVLMMLDDYFGRMSQIVKGHDGVVGKFMGDGLLAFWGVPDKLADHATLAVKAARDMRRALVELNRDRERDGQPPIKIGIGIHTGPVAAGMLGGELQSEYTVIGDAVNVASRIEGLTKEHGVDVLLSETTWAQLGDGAHTHRLAEGVIRGRKEPVVLYALDD
jgi:adenylate cyclase